MRLLDGATNDIARHCGLFSRRKTRTIITRIIIIIIIDAEIKLTLSQ